MSVEEAAGEGNVSSDQSAKPEGKEDHRKALAELARHHHRALVLFLAARVGLSRDKAEELAQETYARVLALDVPAVSFLAGYVWKTARNLATDLGIQKANRARLDQKFGHVESHAPSPEDAVDAQQRLQLLATMLEELRKERPRWHEAFILRFVEQRSFEEVARRMNIAQRNAMEYAAKALRHCQSRLDTAEATRRSRDD